MNLTRPLDSSSIDSLARMANKLPPDIEWVQVAKTLNAEEYRAVMDRRLEIQREEEAERIRSRTPDEVARDERAAYKAAWDAKNGVRRFHGNMGEPWTEEERRRWPVRVSDDYIADPVARGEVERGERFARATAALADLSGSGPAEGFYAIRRLIAEAASLIEDRCDRSAEALAARVAGEAEELRRRMSVDPAGRSDRLQARLGDYVRELRELIGRGGEA